MKTSRKHDTAYWLTTACIVLVAFAIYYMVGCASKVSTTGHAPPDRSESVSAAAAGVGTSADAIDVARADATAKAPEVQPESDRIGTETARLRQYQADLNVAVTDLKATRQHIAELNRELATKSDALAAKLRELEEVKKQAETERTSLMRWVFGGMAGLALVGAVVAVLWLKNMPLALTCGGVVAACIGATYLLAWAKWLAIGLLVLLAMATVYAIWRQRQTAKELVLTAEAFKKADRGDKDAIERAAEQIQTEATKAFVRLVRDPIKKKLAERQAFTS